jgi:hypothetical protein
MADYKYRGEKPSGFIFWTNSIFGHSINGVASPSLNVSAKDSSCFSDIHFSHVGDSGDEGKPFISARDQFIVFITHPKVYDQAIQLVTEKSGALAATQIDNFITRTHIEPETTRPTAMSLLHRIAQGRRPNP